MDIEQDDDELDFAIDQLPFLTKESFAEAIENLVLNENMTYLEAVIAFCEDTNREYEDAVKLMSSTLLGKVKQSARDAGLVERVSCIEGL